MENSHFGAQFISQNNEDYSCAAAKLRAKNLRRHATDMAKAVQALLSMADEIESEADTFETKRRRREATKDVSKEIAKDIFNKPVPSETRDDSVSCNHQ